jgi:hypothetical protein
MHNLKVCVNDTNFEGSKALELPNSNTILVTNIDKVLIFEMESFKNIGNLPITLLQSETREPNQIIGMQKSPDESHIAVISGKNLIMDE